MKISKKELVSESQASGFRAEILEKVIRLISLLNRLRSHPFLRNRLVLKGGTALNLFIFDLPRLSVDIDMNYVGSADRDIMLAERPKIEEAIRAVCAYEGLTVRRIPDDHAGGKWLLRYESSVTQGGSLQLDLNFMFRTPLWPTVIQSSRMLGSYQAENIQLQDIHELSAGKLAALMARHTARDLFDAHQLLTRKNLERCKIRTAFVVYGAMNRKDWRKISADDLVFDAGEIENHLIPMLRKDFLKKINKPARWGKRLIEECHKALAIVLPFKKAELEFLNMLIDYGKIRPSLITDDRELAQHIRYHPMLKWKALNVQKYKGK